MGKKIISIGLSLLLAACANQGQVEKTTTASGINNEQLGVRYLLGRGVRQDDQKAFTYFHRAAQEDNPFAQNELAYLYFTGRGCEQDLAQAFYWYKKAAEHGLSSAQYNLAILYQRGLGTEQNPQLAQFWLAKAKANGFLPAMGQ